jgi:hypothetical protein
VAPCWNVAITKEHHLVADFEEAFQLYQGLSLLLPTGREESLNTFEARHLHS